MIVKLTQFEQGINKRVELFRLGLLKDFNKECKELLEIVSVLDNLQDSITGWKVSMKKFNALSDWDGTDSEKVLIYNSFKEDVNDRRGDLDKHANDFLIKFSTFAERLRND